MKKICLSFLLLIASILLVSCAIYDDFEPLDTLEDFILSPKDFDNINIKGYTPKPLEDRDQDYSLNKFSRAKEPFSAYSHKINLINDSDNEVYINTFIIIFDKGIDSKGYFDLLAAEDIDDIQQQLSNGNVDEMLVPTNYDVDQSLMLTKENYTYIFLRKENVLYRVVIKGLSLTESQVKDTILNKIDFIVNNGIE